MVQRLPQIYSLWRSPPRAEGGLLLSLPLADAAGYLVTIGYHWQQGYPLRLYVENALSLAQSLVLVVLLLACKQRPSASRAAAALLWLGALGALAVAIFARALSEAHMAWLFLANLPLMLAGRLPQIFANWRSGHTGDLSLATFAISLVRALIRIFTTAHRTIDLQVLSSHAVSALLNAVLVLQILLWRDATRRALERASRELARKTQ
jgi:mannose-P-dolichol utilization defect protein 1